MRVPACSMYVLVGGGICSILFPASLAPISFQEVALVCCSQHNYNTKDLLGSFNTIVSTRLKIGLSYTILNQPRNHRRGTGQVNCQLKHNLYCWPARFTTNHMSLSRAEKHWNRFQCKLMASTWVYIWYIYRLVQVAWCAVRGVWPTQIPTTLILGGADCLGYRQDRPQHKQQRGGRGNCDCHWRTLIL